MLHHYAASGALLDVFMRADVLDCVVVLARQANREVAWMRAQS